MRSARCADKGRKALSQTQPTFTLRVPRLLLIGWNVLDQLGDQARSLGGSRALLVTDRVMAGAGYAERARAELAEGGVEVEVYDGVNSEPNDRHCAEALERLRDAHADLV